MGVSLHRESQRVVECHRVDNGEGGATRCKSKNDPIDPRQPRKKDVLKLMR